MEKTTPAANRSAALDALRALAVLLVLGRHFPEPPPGAALPAWLAVWQRGGWIGVDLFFVLSGFLVSGLLFREYRRFGEIRYGHFLARRGFKIYPAFYLMFGAVLLYAAHMGRAFVGWPVVLSEMFFVQNYGPSLFPRHRSGSRGGPGHRHLHGSQRLREHAHRGADFHHHLSGERHDAASQVVEFADRHLPAQRAEDRQHDERTNQRAVGDARRGVQPGGIPEGGEYGPGG